MADLEGYMTAATLELVTDDVVSVEASGSQFVLYRRIVEIPEAYHDVLRREGSCVTFVRTEIGADYPEQMTLTDWETDRVMVEADIDAAYERLFGADSISAAGSKEQTDE